MRKFEIGLLGCTMILLIGMVFSTITMVVFPIAGVFIEFTVMMFVVFIVLSIVVPDIIEELKGR